MPMPIPEETLALIRFLIPIVSKVRDVNTDSWPEACCDLTSSFIDENICARLKKIKVQCGAVLNACSRSGKTDHIWVRRDGTNIDFTAHQFTSLASHTTNVDGFDVLFGNDDYFKSLGYIFYPRSQCEEGLMYASFENSAKGL